MPRIEKVNLELSVVLGQTRMPIHQLLRMGRGAVIELDAHENDAVTILVNDHPIALGSVFVDGERVAVQITKLLMADQAGRTQPDGDGLAEAA